MAKRTYTFEEVKLGELTGFFGFAAAILFALLVTWVSGCGDAGNDPARTDLPVVEIVCDSGCVVLVHNATEVEAYYDNLLAWYDTASGERRLTYVDDPPPGEFTVVACNANGCVESTVER